MPKADCKFSAFLYRYRGYILGIIAVALVCAPPGDGTIGPLIAIPIYVVSAFLRVQSRRFIGEHTRGHVHAADELVTCGPYVHVRHPLYISNTGFALGVAFFHLGVSLWVLAFMVVVVAFEVALSRIEDRFLEQKFGDVWRAWVRKTPAFAPHLGLWGGSSCDSEHVPAQRAFWQAFFADSSARLRGPWPKGPFLWMHGASLGECKMLLNLAKCLKEDLPDCPRLLLTTQKVEVVSFIKESGVDVVAHIAPVDAPATMKSFISSVKPLGLILAENELWPGYLSSMLRISTRPPVALVSGRFHHAVPGMDYAAIGFVSMQTGSDLSRFFSVSARANNSRMMIGGDWKLLPWVRLNKDVSAPENPTVDTVFVSVHIQEMPSLGRMILSSIKRGESVVLMPRRLSEVAELPSLGRMILSSIKRGESVVLMPRRLSEVAEFRKALVDQGISVVDWPQVQNGAVSVVNEFGKTKEVLAVSKTAVVGGSFARGLGVHDFWEPLQSGVSTCVGPYAEGQKEAVATLVREGVIAQLQSAAEYSRRNKPDIRLVQTFLAHESAKISDSYQQLLEFLKNLLK